MSLRIYLSYLFPTLCILHSTTATPPPLSSFPQTNTTPPASIQSFAIAPTWNGTPLPPLTTTLTTISALLALALQPPTNTTTWRPPAPATLLITLTPPCIPARHATWLLASALKTMLAAHRYETAAFALSDGSDPVGTVTYSAPATVEAQLGAASGPFGTTEVEISVAPDARVDASGGGGGGYSVDGTEVRVQVAFSGGEIGVEDFFGAVVDALVALAGEGAGARVGRWGMGFRGWGGGVDVAFRGAERGGAPFLEVGCLSRVLGLLARVVAQRGVGREADVGVFVRGVVVGYGSVRKGGRGAGVGVGVGGWSVANLTLAR